MTEPSQDPTIYGGHKFSNSPSTDPLLFALQDEQQKHRSALHFERGRIATASPLTITALDGSETPVMGLRGLEYAEGDIVYLISMPRLSTLSVALPVSRTP